MTTHQMLPLYEGKMIHHYDHRWATYEPDGSTRDAAAGEKRDPNFVVQPRYWVDAGEVSVRLGDRVSSSGWLLGLRDIARSTDERTTIGALFPIAAVGNNLPLITGSDDQRRLVANLSSFVLDFLARPKVGGVHMNFFIAMQLAVLPPAVYHESSPWSVTSVGEWIDLRVDMLTTDWRDDLRRESARVELDAAFFHLYGLGT